MAVRQHDALGVFTLLYGQCLMLQVIKDAQMYRAPADCAPTFLLAAAIAWSHLSSSEAAILLLAASALLVLALHGSQSNHVLLEALMRASSEGHLGCK